MCAAHSDERPRSTLRGVIALGRALALVALLTPACTEEDAPPAPSAAPPAPRAASPGPAPPEAPTEPARPAPAPPAPDPASAPPPGARTRVVLLGTGTPIPDPERAGPCTAVVTDARALLFDAGPGLVRRATAASRAEPALGPERLEHVFLTHLHSDHTVGLPDLMRTPWVVGRAAPLHVYGPPGTAALVEHLEQAFTEDTRVRTTGLEAQGAGPRVAVRELGPDEEVRVGGLRVRAFRVDHGAWNPNAYGYRVEGAERVVVVSGDTAPTDAIVEACDGCDVLVHEAYAEDAWRRLPEGTRRYHRAFHTSARQLGALAARARPGKLVLTHLLLFGAEPAALLAEVREGWAGPTFVGRDPARH